MLDVERMDKTKIGNLKTLRILKHGTKITTSYSNSGIYVNNHFISETRLISLLPIQNRK
jgi:hypothetical protein